MMSIPNQARELALAQHGTQKYGEHPYSYHLSQVSQLLAEFGYAGDEAIAAAGWLHDTLEDTPTSHKLLVGVNLIQSQQSITFNPVAIFPQQLYN